MSVLLLTLLTAVYTVPQDPSSYFVWQVNPWYVCTHSLLIPLIVLLLVTLGSGGSRPVWCAPEIVFWACFFTFSTCLISAPYCGLVASCTLCMLMTSVARCSATDAVTSVGLILSAIDVISGWMASNSLVLNPSKPSSFGLVAVDSWLVFTYICWLTNGAITWAGGDSNADVPRGMM